MFESRPGICARTYFGRWISRYSLHKRSNYTHSLGRSPVIGRQARTVAAADGVALLVESHVLPEEQAIYRVQTTQPANS